MTWSVDVKHLRSGFLARMTLGANDEPLEDYEKVVFR